MQSASATIAALSLLAASLSLGAIGCGGCDADADCNDDEYCTAEPGSDDGGDCLDRKGSGASCERDRECRSELWCNAGECATHDSGIKWDFTPKCAAAPAVGAGGGSGSLLLSALAASALLARRRRPAATTSSASRSRPAGDPPARAARG